MNGELIRLCEEAEDYAVTVFRICLARLASPMSRRSRWQPIFEEIIDTKDCQPQLQHSIQTDEKRNFDADKIARFSRR
jgi:hypothetical protein